MTRPDIKIVNNGATHGKNGHRDDPLRKRPQRMRERFRTNAAASPHTAKESVEKYNSAETINNLYRNFKISRSIKFSIERIQRIY